MNNADTKKIKVLAYLRKSTEDNKEGEARRQKNSIEYQREVVKEIAERNNLEIVRYFEDSKTGYKAFQREGFDKMLEFFREQKHEGVVKGIVCSEHNRLARNFGDGGLLLWYLQDGLINTIYTHDKIFTNSASDQMMLAINFAMSKHSSDETSWRTKRTWSHRAHTEGQPPNQHLAGYKYTGEKGKRFWTVDKKNAPIVKEMFERFATGEYTVSEIFDYAVSEGLTSPKSKKTYDSEKSIRGLLKKKEYTGIFMYEGEEIKGKYPPLISSELFYKVQEVLSGTAHPKTQGKNEYAYTGLVKCGVCGGNMSGTIRKGITYYRCLHRYEPCKSNKGQRPSYLRETLIDEEITELLLKIQVSDKQFNKLIPYVSDFFEDEKSKYRYEIIQLKGKLTEAQRNLDFYNKELFTIKRVPEKERDKDWLMDKEGLEGLRENAHQEKEMYERQISKAENLKDTVPTLMFNFLKGIKIVGSRFKTASPSNKRQIVDTLCANFKWNGKELSWEWKKPYHLLTNSNEKGRWLRDQDSNLEPNG